MRKCLTIMSILTHHNTTHNQAVKVHQAVKKWCTTHAAAPSTKNLPASQLKSRPSRDFLPASSILVFRCLTQWETNEVRGFKAMAVKRPRGLEILGEQEAQPQG